MELVSCRIWRTSWQREVGWATLENSGPRFAAG
jgi:hypothetical protein